MFARGAKVGKWASVWLHERGGGSNVMCECLFCAFMIFFKKKAPNGKSNNMDIIRKNNFQGILGQ